MVPFRTRLSALQILIHIGAWIPLGVLVYDFFTGHLTINPIQAAEIRTGDIALTLLALSLACTPLFTLTRRSQVIKVRRALGLYAYMYAAIHLLIFTWVDYGLDLQLILQDVNKKPYIIVGLISFLSLSLLAATSFRSWQARLGKNWKRLHQLIYMIILLVILHFGWSVKGDFFRLRGDIFRPLAAGVIILLLLAFRLPAIRRSIARQRQVGKTAERQSGKDRPHANASENQSQG
jgi:sulfoxide reductase heme-binding subunit YedZ